MSEVAVLVGAMLSPLLALALLLWLTHLEDTLPQDVHAARRKPSPPPILSVEVRPAAIESPAAREVSAAADFATELNTGTRSNQPTNVVV